MKDIWIYSNKELNQLRNLETCVRTNSFSEQIKVESISICLHVHSQSVACEIYSDATRDFKLFLTTKKKKREEGQRPQIQTVTLNSTMRKTKIVSKNW